jgi:hypothetical protein
MSALRDLAIREGRWPANDGHYSILGEKAKQRYRLLSDDDGHYYLVPTEKEDEFNAWVNSFNDDEEGDPSGYEELGAVSLGCSPTCVSFTDPIVS